ncbi:MULTISPECIES: DUF885 domain-containing protein [Pseudoalteromonas]|uniref:DUF885 domain-containing protein n=1 Tax=Pseudoalteromonas TaxID=53246 RepID=UPI00026C9134|nr:DUF885 domain-containing protein [Pseudoalteromonas spongiae]ATC99932.1 hypothetical protein PSPO_a3079 [Pseudoalteromonas spongiae UST010723-006]
MKPFNLSLVALTLSSTLLVGCQSTQDITAATSTSVQAQSVSVFESVANDIVAYRKSVDPYQQKEGVNGYFLPDLSPEFLANNHAKNVAFLARLNAVDVSALDEQNRINHAIIFSQVQNSVDEYDFNAHYMPLTSEFGFHSALSFMVSRSSFKTVEDYQLYLKRLAGVPRYFEQNIAWMKKGIAIGLTQPKPVLLGYEDSINAFIVKSPEQSEFYKPFKNKPEHISDADFAKLKTQAQSIISNSVIPSYQSYLSFFETEYAPNARAEIGISTTPNGSEFYQNRVKHYTTTDMTAEQVHQLGLAEVKRIRDEMQQVIAKTGFTGSFAEFVQFLRTDPQFYAKSAEQLLKEASFIAKKADAQLPKFFKLLPRTPYGVAPVPDSIAPKYTTGRYVGANKDTAPGYYWVNTYGLDKRPLYVLEALTLHEAVPGHHLQISLNKELENVPGYRRSHYISAFGEGWGLYSEYLGKEMGFYQDAYSDFGRLTYEMWRAARLVVDTGMHMFGWSRERAMTFMQDNSALSLHNIKTETDRYISWPGQALSYKIGELTIKRLRKKTEQALGAEFDIREFHFQILKNGSLPLNLLEAQIDAYIETAKKA